MCEFSRKRLSVIRVVGEIPQKEFGGISVIRGRMEVMRGGIIVIRVVYEISEIKGIRVND